MHLEQMESTLKQAREARSAGLHAWWWRTLARARNAHLAARGCRDVPREGVTVARPCGA